MVKKSKEAVLDPSNCDTLVALDSQRFADEAAESESDLGAIGAVSDAVVTATDWTTETLLNQLRKGNIKLNPRFQRRDAWRIVRKSRFIESLILGLPVPQIVLAEEKAKRGSYLVIDGKQRLLTLMQFAARPEDNGYEQLKLRDLERRSKLNGLSLSDMEKDPRFANELTAFQNQTIRTVVIKNWPNENFLYLVFLRLNTGSLPLSPQELRQALHPGMFVDFADDSSVGSTTLQRVLDNTGPDFRMRDTELLVRYYGYRNFLSEYSGNLKSFLDYTCEHLNAGWEEQENDIRRQLLDFEQSLKLIVGIFGEGAFRKFSKGRYEPRFNRAVFDIMMYYFSDPKVRKSVKGRQKAKIKSAFENLCKANDSFIKSLESTTKSLEANEIRLRAWGHALAGVLGIKLRLPTLVNNRFVLRPSK